MSGVGKTTKYYSVGGDLDRPDSFVFKVMYSNSAGQFTDPYLKSRSNVLEPRDYAFRPFFTVEELDIVADEQLDEHEKKLLLTIMLQDDEEGSEPSFKLREPQAESPYMEMTLRSSDLAGYQRRAIEQTWGGKRIRPLEALIGNLSMWIAPRVNNNLFIRAGAAYNPETEDIVVVFGERGRGKTITLLELMDRGYELISNSWLRFWKDDANDSWHIYPQGFPENKCAVRLGKDIFESRWAYKYEALETPLYPIDTAKEVMLELETVEDMLEVKDGKFHKLFLQSTQPDYFNIRLSPAHDPGQEAIKCFEPHFRIVTELLTNLDMFRINVERRLQEYSPFAKRLILDLLSLDGASVDVSGNPLYLPTVLSPGLYGSTEEEIYSRLVDGSNLPEGIKPLLKYKLNNNIVNRPDSVTKEIEDAELEN